MAELKKTARYPEHERLAAIDGDNQAIGQFLEWLQDVQEVDLPKPISKLLADYYEIDENKLEKEKRHMLKTCRRAHVFDEIEKDDDSNA